MKKLLLIWLMPLLLYILLFFALNAAMPYANAVSKQKTTIVTASAETPTSGDYACILTDDVYFYSSADERRGIFLLPKSYDVKLLEYRSDFCKVEYQRNENAKERLVGYAKTDQLTFVPYVPDRPYLYYTFDVTYTIEDESFTDSSFLTQITVSCLYYGDYRVGSDTYCYVLRGDELGYIPKPYSLRYEENPEYADYLASQIPPEEDSEEDVDAFAKGEKSSPAQIAILIVICLLVPVLAALVIRPPRRPPYETEE